MFLRFLPLHQVLIHYPPTTSPLYHYFFARWWYTYVHLLYNLYHPSLISFTVEYLPPSTTCFPHHLHNILSLILKPYSFFYRRFFCLRLRLIGSYKWQCNHKDQVSMNHRTPTTRPSDKHTRVPVIWWRWKKIGLFSQSSPKSVWIQDYAFIFSFSLSLSYNVVDH